MCFYRGLGLYIDGIHKMRPLASELYPLKCLEKSVIGACHIWKWSPGEIRVTRIWLGVNVSDLNLTGSKELHPCYEISYIREFVRWISKNWQGRFNSDSRLGPSPAFDLIIKYYLVSQILSIL